MFRLNQPAIQLVNWVVYPLQFALLIPLIRMGEWIFAARPAGISLAQILKASGPRPCASLRLPPRDREGFARCVSLRRGPVNRNAADRTDGTKSSFDLGGIEICTFTAKSAQLFLVESQGPIHAAEIFADNSHFTQQAIPLMAGRDKFGALRLHVHGVIFAQS